MACTVRENSVQYKYKRWKGNTSMKEIQLTRGKVAIIDDDDYDRVSTFRWNWDSRYAKRTVWFNGKCKTIMMHSFIMGCPMKGLVTDHINRNKLDNRKSNLRICTQKENMDNVGEKSLPIPKGMTHEEYERLATELGYR